jgi:hypothetical protein
MIDQDLPHDLRSYTLGGDKAALDRLVPLLYPELRRLARGYLRNERRGHTLQPTALVHEAYSRLVKQDQPDYRSRAHFIAKCLSSSVMGWVSVNFNILDAFLMTFEAGFGARERGGGAGAHS